MTETQPYTKKQIEKVSGIFRLAPDLILTALDLDAFRRELKNQQRRLSLGHLINLAPDEETAKAAADLFEQEVRERLAGEVPKVDLYRYLFYVPQNRGNLHWAVFTRLVESVDSVRSAVALTRATRIGDPKRSEAEQVLLGVILSLPDNTETEDGLDETLLGMLNDGPKYHALLMKTIGILQTKVRLATASQEAMVAYDMLTKIDKEGLRDYREQALQKYVELEGRRKQLAWADREDNFGSDVTRMSLLKALSLSE